MLFSSWRLNIEPKPPLDSITSYIFIRMRIDRYVINVICIKGLKSVETNTVSLKKVLPTCKE